MTNRHFHQSGVTLLILAKLGIILVILCVGCSRDSVTSQNTIEVSPSRTRISFSEESAVRGLRHVVQSGAKADAFSILEVMPGGVAAVDFDRNGATDLFFSGGGGFDVASETVTGNACALFLNNDGLFVPAPARLLTDLANIYSIGVTRADLNSDGWDDLVVCGYEKAVILFNQGDGTVDVRTMLTDEAGKLFAVGAVGADLNQDGFVDLFITNYCNWSFNHHPFCEPRSSGLAREICGPTAFDGLRDILMYSDGTGIWSAPPLEIDFTNAASYSKGLGVVAGDLNNDRLVDVYVANDGQANSLYLNQGDHAFVESGISSGLAVGGDARPNGSMGIATGDVDCDGLIDVLVTNFYYEPMALYRGKSPGVFGYASRKTGLESCPTNFVSWGASLTDFDLDGWLDLIVANGHVYRAPEGNSPAQPGLIFENEKSVFRPVTPFASDYFSKPHMGRGLAVLDVQSDGLPDVAVAMLDEPVALLMNTSQSVGRSLEIELVGTRSPRDPIGAIVSLNCTAGPRNVQLTAGGGYASASQKAIFVGIPAGDVLESLTVSWPSGQQATYPAPASNRMLIVEDKTFVNF